MKKRYIFSAKKFDEWCRQTGNDPTDSLWQYACDGCEIDAKTQSVKGKNGKWYACSTANGERFPWYEVQEVTEVGDEFRVVLTDDRSCFPDLRQYGLKLGDIVEAVHDVESDAPLFRCKKSSLLFLPLSRLERLRAAGKRKIKSWEEAAKAANADAEEAYHVEKAYDNEKNYIFGIGEHAGSWGSVVKGHEAWDETGCLFAADDGFTYPLCVTEACDEDDGGATDEN